jgi:hypothetical protein
LIPLNLTLTQSFHFAQILGCKLGKLPLKYLGVSLHWRKPSRAIWLKLVTKIQCRLQIWKWKFLSMGGRLVLLNSILSSILLYYLSLFRIPVWCLNKIDKIRRDFLWAGVDSKKYSLVRWSIVCSPKQFGGFGVLNLKYMNLSLLAKWWWLYQLDSDSL